MHKLDSIKKGTCKCVRQGFGGGELQQLFHARSEPAPAAPKATCCRTELSHKQYWLCSGRAGLRNKKGCATAGGREEWEIREKQPWGHQGQCRRRAGGALGTEQKLSAAQERPIAEQTIPVQPKGTMQSTCPGAAWAESSHEGVGEAKYYGLTTAPAPLCHKEEEGE